MQIENIKSKLTKILENYDLVIYSIKPKREFGEKILEILLKGKDISNNKLEEVHRKLLDVIDDDIDDDYFLELASLGAEYPLANLEEIKAHIDGYVYVETNKFKSVALLLEVIDSSLIVKYNHKGQFRKIKIEYDEILNIRTSVKI